MAPHAYEKSLVGWIMGAIVCGDKDEMAPKMRMESKMN
jgi:hypothetical protein